MPMQRYKPEQIVTVLRLIEVTAATVGAAAADKDISGCLARTHHTAKNCLQFRCALERFSETRCSEGDQRRGRGICPY